MKMSNVVDPKLIGMGLGVFAATFLSAQLVDKLDDQTGFVGDYAREIAGAVLTVGGSLLMGNKETKTIGLAMGATGVSTVASGLVRRITGKTASAPPQSSGVVNIPSDWNWSKPPIGGGAVLASVPVANGRGAFTLA
jgi:hypothetical protein